MKTTSLLSIFCASACFIYSCSQENDPNPDSDIAVGDIVTIAGQGPTESGADGDGGAATSAKMGWVTGVAVDSDGNVFITDGAANTIRMISQSDGKISKVAGIFLGWNVPDPTPYTGDGGPASDAHLSFPAQATVDGSGNLFFADAANHVIRMVSKSDGKISTFAGKGPGFYDYDGDGVPATTRGIWNPYGVAADGEGNIYFADSQNNAVRKVTRSTGVVTTIAGLGPSSPGYSGDGGPAVDARLNMPSGVAVDQDGNIYIGDLMNNVVRKISGGTITTIAGSGEVGFGGDGGAATSAKFASIKGIAVDKNGNVFIADASNNRVRKVDGSTGIITTVAGNGTAAFSGDGGPATSAGINNPWGIAVDGEGNLYIADTNNSAIRLVIMVE